MRLTLFISAVFYLLFGCTNSSKSKSDQTEKSIIFQENDKIILDSILVQLKDKKALSTSDLVIEAGKLLIETPYVEHTLESEPEQLVINLRGMDCNTFAENCLAIARTIKSNTPGFDQFTEELLQIRYRDGIIDQYPSRLHYFSDWIYNNTQKKIVQNVSKNISDTPYPLNIDFMSTHPDSYQQLKNNDSFVSIISDQEKEISTRTMYYIPENKILEIEDLLQDGDIAGITTNVGGLDIQHVVLLVRQNDRIHLLHASSAAGKVIISDETLEEYLLNSNSTTGIMVARPI